MVLGLGEPIHLHWDHIDYHFGVNVRHDSSEDTIECSGPKYYRLRTNG